MTADCIDDNEAALFARGSLDESVRQRVEQHVDECASCRILVAELARQSTTTHASETLLPPGALVNRYVLGGVLGAGAMGVVYSAEDPQLGRHVALKLVRPRLTTPTGSTVAASADESEDEERLLAEAHATAQLSHPNVVTVFDAGRWRDQVFIALELVRGRTLGEWLFTGPRRSLAEVLAHFRAAGAGLAAAHAAGIVHRDFKPDNVLVGDDGRVRVTDFGLARSLEAEGQPGVLAGTPAYMAPEQRDRGIADARSDQYSFAVALWEALYGSLPQAPPDAPRKHSGAGRVPRRIRRAVERGLSRDPAARYPSMTGLVEALEWDPAAQLRRMLLSLLLLLLSGVVGLMLARSNERAKLCQGGADRFSQVISPERWSALSLLPSGSGPLAAEAAQRRRGWVAQLEAYRTQWLSLYSDACSATRLRGDQSPELMERRMSCLESRLQGADVLVGLLLRNDPALETRLAGRELLDPLEPCADRAALLEPVPPPHDEALRRRIAAVRSELGRIMVLDNAGEYKSALQQAVPLLAEARSIGYSPLLGEAMFRLAVIHYHTGDPAAEHEWIEAAWTGEEAHNDVLVAWARTHLLWTVAVRNGHTDQVERLIGEAEAAVKRAGNARAEDFLLDTRASLATDPKEAERLYLQLIARLQSNAGRERLDLGQAENNLATVYLDNNKLPDALVHFDRAIAIEEKTLGAHHSAVLLVRRNRVMALGGMGHPRDFIGEARALLTDTETALGPDYLDTGYALLVYGAALADGPASRPESVVQLSRSLAVFSAKLPPESEPAFEVHSLLCDALVALKRTAEAEPHCRATLAYGEKEPGNEHGDLRSALTVHAGFLLDSGAAAAARAELERAFSLTPAAEKWDPKLLASARFTLARALASTHGDRQRARELAALAEATWLGSGEDEQLARVRAWLKGH